MAKTAVIRARVEPELKTDAERILRELGLSPTEAVTLFYRQIKMRQGLPFAVRIPDEVTLQTFQDTDDGKNIVRAQSKEDLFEKLEI